MAAETRGEGGTALAAMSVSEIFSGVQESFKGEQETREVGYSMENGTNALRIKNDA